LAGLILQRKTNRYGLQDVKIAGKQLESAVVYSALKEKGKRVLTMNLFEIGILSSHA
jgi:hypothetical protein